MAYNISIRKMAAAIRLMDSFTGQAVWGRSMQVRMEDGAVPVAKPGGYYIFWDNGMTKRRLLAEGHGYEPAAKELDLYKLQAKGRLSYNLWLIPDSAYDYPPDVEFREAQGRPGEVGHFPIESSADCIRLMDAYPMDALHPELLHMDVPDGMELENRHLVIRGREGEEETFCIWRAKNRAMGIYELEKPLEHVYGPYEAKLLLTMPLRADAAGRAAVPGGGLPVSSI